MESGGGYSPCNQTLSKAGAAHCTWPHLFVYKFIVVFSGFCSILWGSSGGAPKVKVILSKSIFRIKKELVLF